LPRHGRSNKAASTLPAAPRIAASCVIQWVYLATPEKLPDGSKPVSQLIESKRLKAEDPSANGFLDLAVGSVIYDFFRIASVVEFGASLTIVKSRRRHAHFFHNGHSVWRNGMAFLPLRRPTIVKTAYGFFHNGPAKCYLDLNHACYSVLGRSHLL
jgi:hypothetical protein